VLSDGISSDTWAGTFLQPSNSNHSEKNTNHRSDVYGLWLSNANPSNKQLPEHCQPSEAYPNASDSVWYAPVSLYAMQWDFSA
jgi:hypothetical protein